MMNQDGLTSGINGRLRSRKVSRDLHYPGLTADKNNDFPTTLRHNDHYNPLHLCPYCDKAFNIKPSLTKHINRVHIKGPNQNSFIECQYCKHNDNPRYILKHMIDNHSNHYFACFDCHIRLPSAEELEKHKHKSCEKINKKDQVLYKSKLRSRCNPISSLSRDRRLENNVDFAFPISCELKPTKLEDPDIENNITANVIIPSYKSIIHNSRSGRNIVAGEEKKYKDKTTSFCFNTALETGQFLSRLGVVHRSQNNDIVKYNEFKYDEATIKFERCFNKIFFSKVGNNIQENLTKFLDGSLNQKKNYNDNILFKRKGKKYILNTFQGFPVLLAPEQCIRNTIPNNFPRLTLPKHKSKLGHNECDKFLLDKPLKRDPHADNCIITAISKLDIWTQQLMRQRFENLLSSTSIRKDNTKNDLKKHVRITEFKSESFRFVNSKTDRGISEYQDFPFSLGLNPSTPTLSLTPATLSGEWARPRKYVCCACGEQYEDSKSLASHISGEHPNSQIDYCEIVGEHLQYEEVFKDLYKSSQSPNRIRPIRGSRECTKCKKPISFDDLHEHILECAGDTPVVRRKCRNRPFGVRRRRARLPDNTIRKKIRKDLRSGHSLKNKRMKPKYKRTDVGDGETIRKMLADLPAKRHRMPITSSSIHKKIEIPRNRLRLRQRITDNKSMKIFKDPKINVNTIKMHTNEIIRSRNIKPKSQNSFIRRNPVRRSALAKKEDIKIIEIPHDTTSENNKKHTLATFSTPNDSDQNNTQRSSNDQLSMGNNPNKISFNGSFNSKERSSQDGSNNQGSWRQAPNEPNKSNSRNNTPHKVPLKHSIEKITENIHSKVTNRFDQNILMDQPYITNYTQSTHLMSVVQKPLFEKETAVIKLDKPPLSQTEDFSTYHKNKLNKPRKGLNDCIAMLKNKLHEPIECTTNMPLIKENSMPPSADAEIIKNNHYEDLKPAISDGRMILPAHINQTNEYTGPLDLSGKSLNAGAATNLCIKEIENSELTTENYNKSTPIDLSFRQITELGSLDLSAEKSISDESCEESVSNASTILNPQQQNDENEGESENYVLQNISENLAVTELINSKDLEQTSNTYDQNQTSEVGNETQAGHVGYLHREIVDLLGTMPPGQRNTLLDVLPKVITQTVKQLKIAVDSGSNEESLNVSSIATQTLNDSDTLAEIMNMDANKYLIDTLSVTVSESSKQNTVLLNLIKDGKIIDLPTNDSNIWPPTTNVDRKPVIIDPQSFRKHKSNEQTTSLRAVRIKSSSDKNKNIKHITNVLNESRELQSESSYVLSHDIAYNNVPMLQHNKLSLQHTDLNSTQYSNYGNSLIAQPTMPSEVGGIITEHNLDISKHINHPQGDNIDTVIPSMAQSLSIMNSSSNIPFKSIDLSSDTCGQNSDHAKSLNGNNSKGDEEPSVQDINMDTAIHSKSIYEKIEVIPLQSSTPIAKNIVNTEKVDDDDSEDDISLAVIVKKRQLKENSVVTNNDTLDESNTYQLKEGTQKKNKKITLAKKSKELTHSIDDILHSDTNIFSTIKGFKKRDANKCIYESVIRETRCETNEDPCYDNKLSFKSQKRQINENTLFKKDINIPTKAALELTENYIHNPTLKTCQVSPIVVLSKSNEDNSDISQQNTCQLEEDDVFKPEISEISSTSNEFHFQSNDKQNVKKGATKKRKSKKNVLKNNEMEKTIQPEAEKSNTLNNENVQNDDRSLKTGIVELISENVEAKCEVPIAAVKVVENKKPMAKKQLIFSKLLQDQKCLNKKLKDLENENCNLVTEDTNKTSIDPLTSNIKQPEQSKVKILNPEDNVTPNNIKSRKGISACKSKTINAVKITDFFCGDEDNSNLQEETANETLKSIVDKKRSKKKLLDTNACILKSQRRILRSTKKAPKQQDNTYPSVILEETIKTELDEEKNDISQDFFIKKSEAKNAIKLTKCEPLNKTTDILLKTNKVNKLSIDELDINDSGNEDDSSFIKDNAKPKRIPMPRLKPKTIEVRASNSKSTVEVAFTPNNSYSQASTSGSKTQKSKYAESRRITRTLSTSVNRKMSARFCLSSSDSDDSSSDTPLRNYVGESSKFDNHPNDSGINISISDKVSNKKTITRNRRSAKGTNKLDNSQLTEEQKSEQFMESFGFFSERKPRKSNLIAAKKIAETFHRANESDEVYFSKKRNTVKKPKTNEQKIKKILSVMNDDDRNGNTSSEPSAKRSKQRRKKKKKIIRPFCTTCQKRFKRPDNFCRHIMSSYHASKVAEIELKLEVDPVPDTPNLLITLRKRLDKLKRMNLLNAELKKEGKNIIQLPTVGDIISDIQILHEKQKQIEARRGLSRDEALFIDCCEMLKESHKNENPENITNVIVTEPYLENPMTTPSTAIQNEMYNKNNNKSDDDMDSITAQTIMESDEVRNLENDLISGFKEAVAYSLKKNCDQCCNVPDNNIFTINHEEVIIKAEPTESLYNNEDKAEKEMLFDKRLSHQEDQIYIFEDKFDKIKRKSRSAAAAKHVQPIIEDTVKSAKKRKKSVKKSKNKKHSKKDQPNTVPTKGALKGFDSIKVSEPKSDAHSKISPVQDERTSSHKKKKNSSKKRKLNSKHLSYLPRPIEDEAKKEIKIEIKEKEIDVYEFMDNEDTDMLQFRMTKRREHKKRTLIEMPGTSKVDHVFIKVPSISSGSDVDDFVYMSDDYVCSDNETEHSLTSCEVKKNDKSRKKRKSSSKSKRKQSSGKHTAMGKIFKNNAVRNKRKRKSFSSDSMGVKANLDQLFDSLLDNELTASNNSDELKLIKEEPLSPQPVIEEELETGVARQRARRKCTVGKQNVLAETWSSESETDVRNAGRPNSVETVLLGGRKKKPKRNNHQTSSRRSRGAPVKTEEDKSAAVTIAEEKPADAVIAERSEEQSHPPPPEPPKTFAIQHGWIVGNSHKKLVTMLAHAKGRKRSDKRPTTSNTETKV